MTWEELKRVFNLSSIVIVKYDMGCFVTHHKLVAVGW
jgi:hypothetical protein